eukprot:scaffold9696_cov112-Isochrysis_galbana.AAC.3
MRRPWLLHRRRDSIVCTSLSILLTSPSPTRPLSYHPQATRHSPTCVCERRAPQQPFHSWALAVNRSSAAGSWSGVARSALLAPVAGPGPVSHPRFSPSSFCN